MTPMSVGDPAQSAEAAHCPQVPPGLGGRAMGWASDPHTAVQAPQPIREPHGVRRSRSRVPSTHALHPPAASVLDVL